MISAFMNRAHLHWSVSKPKSMKAIYMAISRWTAISSLVFNQHINAEHFNTNMVHVASAEGTAVTPSAIVFDPSLPNCITLSFADGALDYYTDYEITLDGSLTDVSGQCNRPGGGQRILLHAWRYQRYANANAAFDASGGGYVMPDEYNISYLFL